MAAPRAVDRAGAGVTRTALSAAGGSVQPPGCAVRNKLLPQGLVPPNLVPSEALLKSTFVRACLRPLTRLRT